jgi:hypothetical protein
MSSIWLMLKPRRSGKGVLGSRKGSCPSGFGDGPVCGSGKRFYGVIGSWTHSGPEKTTQARHYARPGIGARGIPSPSPAGPFARAQNARTPGPDSKEYGPTRFFPAQLSQCLMAASRIRPR